jgi:hypothetical protein
MGNRLGGSRSKSRDSKYKYPNNGTTNNGSNGHTDPRLFSSQSNGYSQHPYSNGYGQTNGGHVISNTQYTINQTQQPQYNTNTNSNKIIYVANYDFNGTSTTGELSFVKGDRLEILDRLT